MAGIVREEAVNIVRSALKIMSDKKGFGSFLEKMSIISAGNGNCEAELIVDKNMTNLAGTLHGGCTATIVDVVSTLGLLTLKNYAPGVSVNLNINYLKGVKEGESLIVDSKATKLGKHLAFLDVQLKMKNSGAIIATGSHVKYIAA